jgi:putative nucleotidyltransferase with HDIG domain
MTGRLGRLGASFRGALFRRLLSLVVASLGAGALVAEYVRVPIEALVVGDVAERPLRASSTFPFVDWNATLERQRKAEAQVEPVWDFDATLSGRMTSRISGAFEAARDRMTEAQVANRRARVDDETRAAISVDFLHLLDLSLDPQDLERVAALNFNPQVEELSNQLVAGELSRFIVADRALLPSPVQPLLVLRVLGESRDEVRLEDYKRIRSPEDARQAIRMEAFDPAREGIPTDLRLAAVSVAQAAMRANLSYNQLITEGKRREAREAVNEVVIQVKRGTSLVREGDVITASQVEMVRALMQARGGYSTVGLFVALSLFAGLVFLSLYFFASGYIKKFSSRPRGMGMVSTSIWYLAPVGGGAMLIRILVNSETALVWAIGTGLMMGLMMDHEVFYSIFFIISGTIAAGGIAHTKERVGVLRAGVLTGLVNVAGALLINLLLVQMGESSGVGTSQPMWDMGFAFLGGNLSAIMVLGMVPMFELFGFITSYKLLELANLNHPLLRQLMLRAPGTYHHSVIVGSLAENAAESIGCNALLARVSCYFHDVGKMVKPNYFIENLRDAPNPHDRLAPHQSARIIINHVLDGAAIARQYKLPKPIVDGVLMHHGTGIIQYFYAKAVEQAEDASTVNVGDFRYPGLLPDSREAGIIFLADRVEAACRTLKDPTNESIRAMIQTLVNSAITDGQLERCPLTIRDLYTVVDAFTSTLLGIYHHRIEYPGMPVQPPSAGSVPDSALITLDVANPVATEGETDPIAEV